MNISTDKLTTYYTVGTHNQDSLTLLPKKILKLNLERLKQQVTSTSDNGMTLDEWDEADTEYRRFLALKIFYPGLSLIPSNQVAKLWQAHILDTRAYREDCEKMFGRFIDHYPYFGIYGKEDYRLLQTRFVQTVKLYERHFGPYPKSYEELANHCEDHASQEVAL